MAIFHPTSPIHDGAVIIQEGRVAAAACFLPLTRDENVDPNVGTRHRAAMGISQETDAIVVVVSEESAGISIVVDGEISKDLDIKELRKTLRTLVNRAIVDPDRQDSSNLPKGSNSKGSIFEKLRIFNSGNKK